MGILEYEYEQEHEVINMNPLFTPRVMEFHGGKMPLFLAARPAFKIVVADDADPVVYEAARLIREAFDYPVDSVVTESKAGKGNGIFLCTPDGPSRFAGMVEVSRAADAPKNRDQAYEIKCMGNDVLLLGFTPQALVHAARALSEISDGCYIPEMTVFDYPDLQYRGIYVECRWGPDNMTMADWEHAFDQLAAMRMNIVSIGLYNNWPAQYDGKVSEWMMVPIKKYPKLKTPLLVNYYSSAEKKDIRFEYIPRMYREDLFGEIIKLAKSKGIIVRPHFNTPGHNTQIPRNYPETSAKFPDGTPKKYGFCMSSLATLETMFGIFDEICDKYLLPNGIDFFHIGLDEVYPLVGMNEDTPLLRIDPWCECPECAKTTPEDRFVNYAVSLATHLKEKGMKTIGMWHDHFSRGGKMNDELSRRFEEAGLKENAVLHWWRYADFYDTTMPELGFRRWVVPMTGYFYWINYQNHLDNCFLAAEKGVEENCEGIEAYGVWHPSYHQHYAMQGAKSWNSANWPDKRAFRAEYAKSVFGDRWQEGLRAFHYFDDICAGPGMMNFLSKYFAYPYLYAGWEADANIKANYPQMLIEQLIDNPLNFIGFMAQISGYVQKAIDIFSRDGLWTSDSGRLKDLYVTECLRIKAVMDLFPRMINAVKACRNGVAADKLSEWADSIDKAVEYLDGAMLSVETHWEAAFVPQTLREFTLMREFAVKLSTELRTGPSKELMCMMITPVDWPND